MLSTPLSGQISSVAKSSNILSLIGNGFDIQVLNHLGRSATTTYPNFYDHAKSAGISHKNPILHKMEEARSLAPGDTDWSDIEAAIGQLDPNEFSFSSIQPHLSEIQYHFASFLNQVVTPEVLSGLDRLSTKSDLAIHSLAHLFEDVEEADKLTRLLARVPGQHDTVFNHTFVNFNYTDLLDNYLFLDSTQFDPRPYLTSANNFRYNNDPRGIVSPAGSDNVQSCELDTHVLHPHGRQSTPRSLLFGTGSLLDATTSEARLTKPFRARYEDRYSTLFHEADIFIIFGSSLGKSDSWWWSNVVTSLHVDRSKSLILYVYGGSGAGNAAIDSLLQHSDLDDSDKHALLEQIILVTFANSTDHSFLGMATQCTSCTTDPKGLGYKILKRT